MLRGNGVAIIDDDAALLDSMKFLLEAEGYDVATYNSPGAFLAGRDECPACLIVDQFMPGEETGLEFIARLRRREYHLPVLLISGSPSFDMTRNAARLDVAAALAKPVPPETLLRFVKRYC